MKEPISTKAAKVSMPCAVCGRPSYYIYYTVVACESCKQFFRRNVLKMSNIVCQYENCNFSQDSPCRPCRLDKCLKVGMQPVLIGLDRKNEIDRAKIERNIAKLEARRAQLQGKAKKGDEVECEENEGQGADHNWKMNLHNMFEDSKRMEDAIFLANLKTQQNIAWEISQGRIGICAEYFNQKDSLEAIVMDRNNLLANFEQHRRHPNNKYNSAGSFFLDLFSSSGPFAQSYSGAPTFQKCIVPMAKCFLVHVNIAKALPSFEKLSLEEKTSLIYNSVCAANFLQLSYNSAKQKSRTMLNTGGQSLSRLLAKDKNCLFDQIVMNSARKIYENPMEDFLNANLEADEFVLLMAMLLSNSAINGLSAESQCTLRGQEEQCGRILLWLQQRRFGQAGGAHRYMETLRLIGGAIRQAQRYREMNNYIDSMYSNERGGKGNGNTFKACGPWVVPKFIHQLTK